MSLLTYNDFASQPQDGGVGDFIYPYKAWDNTPGVMFRPPKVVLYGQAQINKLSSSTFTFRMMNPKLYSFEARREGVPSQQDISLAQSKVWTIKNYEQDAYGNFKNIQVEKMYETRSIFPVYVPGLDVSYYGIFTTPTMPGEAQLTGEIRIIERDADNGAAALRKSQILGVRGNGSYDGPYGPELLQLDKQIRMAHENRTLVRADVNIVYSV